MLLRIGGLKLLSSNGVIDPTLYAHIETVSIAGSTYYTLKTVSADTSGGAFSRSTSSTGRYLLTYNNISSRFVFPLNGITKILSCTIYMVYRAYASGGTVYLNIDILIRKADGTVRTTLATNVCKSANLPTSYTTLISESYNLSEYVVVDQTDYLEIDIYANITTARAGRNAYMMVDNNTLALSDQTRLEGLAILLPTYTIAPNGLNYYDVEISVVTLPTYTILPYGLNYYDTTIKLPTTLTLTIIPT